MDQINEVMLAAVKKYAALGLAGYMFEFGTTTRDGDGELCVFVYENQERFDKDGYGFGAELRLVDTVIHAPTQLSFVF